MVILVVAFVVVINNGCCGVVVQHVVFPSGVCLAMCGRCVAFSSFVVVVCVMIALSNMYLGKIYRTINLVICKYLRPPQTGILIHLTNFIFIKIFIRTRERETKKDKIEECRKYFFNILKVGWF